MWHRVWQQWSILSAVWNNKETSTGKSVQFRTREAGNRGFRYDTIVHSLGEYHEIYKTYWTGYWVLDRWRSFSNRLSCLAWVFFLSVLLLWRPSIAIRWLSRWRGRRTFIFGCTYSCTRMWNLCSLRTTSEAKFVSRVHFSLTHTSRTRDTKLCHFGRGKPLTAAGCWRK